MLISQTLLGLCLRSDRSDCCCCNDSSFEAGLGCYSVKHGLRDRICTFSARLIFRNCGCRECRACGLFSWLRDSHCPGRTTTIESGGIEVRAPDRIGTLVGLIAVAPHCFGNSGIARGLRTLLSVRVRPTGSHNSYRSALRCIKPSACLGKQYAKCEQFHR